MALRCVGALCVGQTALLCTEPLLPVSVQLCSTAGSKRKVVCACQSCYLVCNTPAHTLPLMSRTSQAYFRHCNNIALVSSTAGSSALILLSFTICVHLKARIVPPATNSCPADRWHCIVCFCALGLCCIPFVTQLCYSTQDVHRSVVKKDLVSDCCGASSTANGKEIGAVL